MTVESAHSLLLSWRQEKEAAYLYDVLSGRVKETRIKALFLALGEEAEEQAQLWATVYTETYAKSLPPFSPSIRTQCIKQLICWFGPKAIRKILSAAKIRGMSIYHPPLGHAFPESIEDVGQRHQSSEAGNRLRAGVFGINDGIISNTSLILGLTGAHVNTHTLILAGVAGLLAGAFSMASGEYISVRSQREMLEYQIELERKELALYPEEEAAELALIYEARGLNKADAQKTATLLIQDSEHALQTLIREELGLDPDELASPYHAAITSFMTFICGAGIPLLPFLLGVSTHPLVYTVLLSAIVLFTVGAVLSLFSGKQAFKNGFRMLGLGAVAGGLTYTIGLLFS